MNDYRRVDNDEILGDVLRASTPQHNPEDGRFVWRIVAPMNEFLLDKVYGQLRLRRALSTISPSLAINAGIEPRPDGQIGLQIYIEERVARKLAQRLDIELTKLNATMEAAYIASLGTPAHR